MTSNISSTRHNQRRFSTIHAKVRQHSGEREIINPGEAAMTLINESKQALSHDDLYEHAFVKRNDSTEGQPLRCTVDLIKSKVFGFMFSWTVIPCLPTAYQSFSYVCSVLLIFVVFGQY